MLARNCWPAYVLHIVATIAMVSILIPLILSLVAPSNAVPYSGTIIMPVDHFNASDTRTFLNHYWMNDAYYEPGGPVFLADGGEAGVSDAIAASLLSESGSIWAPLELARRFRGIAIVWEHRFYGGSLPFEVDNITGVALAKYDAYKYLDNEQSLEDVVYLANHFNPPNYGDTLAAKSTPWIFIGGSYAGARTAMIRVRNPDTIFASFSSSGVVEAQWNYSDWWNPLYQNMPSNCSADTHAAVAYADNILAHGTPADISLLKKIAFLTHASDPRNQTFGAPYPPNSEDLSYWQVGEIFGWVFQRAFFSFQSYGYQMSMGTFCNQMQRWNPSNFSGFDINSTVAALSHNTDDAPITSSGVAATHGVENAFSAYIFATISKMQEEWALFPVKNLRSPADNAAWIWQLCTQMAQFQVSQYPSPHSLISRYYNLTGVTDHFCRDVHPYAPAQPDVGAILKYGGWNMKPSNVMFTNGEIDTFRGVTVQATQKYTSGAPNRPSTRTVPPCNHPPKGDDVFGIVHPNQVHGSDIQRRSGNVTGYDPVMESIELFTKALNTWLPCFKPLK